MAEHAPAALAEQEVAAAAGDDIEDYGEEDDKKSKQVYLVTFPHPRSEVSPCGARLKAPGTFTRPMIQEFGEAMASALEATQRSRGRPLVILRMCIFQEKHHAGHIHYHVALKADRCFMFRSMKRFLLEHRGLASHWSCTHEGYASCVAYGYLPSQKKPLGDLDKEPLLWAPPGDVHPPLAEASVAPMASKALEKRRQDSHRQRAEQGKPERFKAIDLWPIVVRENINANAAGCSERLMAYARRSGGEAMVEFCFNNYPKLEEVVARCWQVEKVEDHVADLQKSRMTFLEEACRGACVCGGRWVPAAKELFVLNELNEARWREAVLGSLRRGREKGSLVCHAGKEGNEGKSFLLSPLYEVFGRENVFTSPPRSAFPLLDLPKARVVVLDDWRFNEDIVSYPLQLLWFKGKPFVIARPQNQFTGHLRYNKDDPIFISTLEQDLHALKKNILPGDRDMMLKRLDIYKFHTKLQRPDTTIPACASCFSRFLLGEDAPVLPVTSAHGAAGSGAQRPPGKRARSWSIGDVAEYLEGLGLAHLVERFCENAVDGEMLAALTEEDLIVELGVTRLQAKKILARMG